MDLITRRSEKSGGVVVDINANMKAAGFERKEGDRPHKKTIPGGYILASDFEDERINHSGNTVWVTFWAYGNTEPYLKIRFQNLQAFVDSFVTE